MRMTVQKAIELLNRRKPDDELLVEDSEGNLSYLLDVADIKKEGYTVLVAKDRIVDESEL